MDREQIERLVEQLRSEAQNHHMIDSHYLETGALLNEAADALEGLASDAARVCAIRRFTSYRRNISERATHNELQKNPDDQPQFEGVIFSDGSVALRWRTAIHCTSVWSSLEDALAIHGHPEYGTEIVWHDCDVPPEWQKQLDAA